MFSMNQALSSTLALEINIKLWAGEMAQKAKV